MTETSGRQQEAIRYVGTLVGESTSREFRLAVAHEAIREQDIIAVDARLRRPEGPTEDGSEAPTEDIRVWAKVQRIERLNPLFPSEAGHELAATQTNPFDTVLSLSREMVTAVCQVLGSEPLEGGKGGKLDHLRYPAQPATSAYGPDSTDVARVVFGKLGQKKEEDSEKISAKLEEGRITEEQARKMLEELDKSVERRALDIARLSNRPEVDVKVDGHAIVARHLAILAMTGAGKSWTARRIIEQLAKKNFPIVIFDPHGDYTGLADVPSLRRHVKLFYADLPLLEEDLDDASRIISGLSGEEMNSAQYEAFELLFSAVPNLLGGDNLSSNKLKNLLLEITGNPNIEKYGLGKDLFALSYIAQAVSSLAKQKGSTPEKERLAELGFEDVERVDGRLARTYGVLARQLRRAAFALREMERLNRQSAGRSEPLPADHNELVKYGQVSVISLAGYTEEFRATLYTLICRHLFRARTQGVLPYRYLMVLEEAHNYVPNRAEEPAVARSIAITKQIAQEGRKFGVGLLLISQRPSRLDETTLSMCNSYIVMRMVNPADRSFVRQVVETMGEDDVRMLPDLDTGEAILSGQLVNFPVLVKAKEPESTGEREERDAFEELEDSYRESANGARR
jgi:DNA helicase HerA-like ATPase